MSDTIQCTQCGNSHAHWPEKVEGCHCCERMCREKVNTPITTEIENGEELEAC